MNSSMRTKMAPVERLRGPAACVAAGLLLSACSADVTRFDFPAFSLGQNGDTTAALPAPPEPIYQFNEPKAADKLPSYGAQKPYKVAQADTGVTRSNLGQPADTVDALQPVDRRQPVRVRRYEPDPYSDSEESIGSRAVGSETVVQRGDTLYGISRRTGVSVARIKAANNLRGSNILVGQKLVIPGGSRATDTTQFDAPRTVRREPTRQYDEPRTTARVGDRLQLEDNGLDRPAFTSDAGETYRVRAGDSLYAIARKTGVSAKKIAAANGIHDPSRLSIGQVLTIPGTSTSSDFGETAEYDKPLTTAKRRTVVPKPRKVASLDRSAGLDDDSFDAPRKLTPSTSFRWPVRGRIVSRFGGKTASGNNDGINLAVPEGTSVKAVEDGVVAYAGSELKGYGQLLLIRHDDDWVSAYAHNSRLLAKRGDKVRRGQTIAKAGRTGSVDRPQVHFELRKGSKPVDPLKYLARN